MNYTEQELRQAAVLVRNRQLAAMEQCVAQTELFGPGYRQRMQELCTQVRQGKVPQAAIHMGWQYYAQRGAAVLLLGAVLTVLAMPEVVQAAYQKLIESVETVFDTHTEFRFTSHASADSEFVPLTITWLPEDLVEVERTERPGRVCYEYETQETGDRYFVLFQDYMKPGSSFEYGIDTEDAEQEIVYIRQSEVRLVHKDGKTNFIWYNDSLFITGQSNLDTDQIVKILNGLKYR